MKKSRKMLLCITAIVSAIALVVSACLVLAGTLAADGAAPRYGQLSSKKFVDVQVAHDNGVALDSDGVVWIWGENNFGTLGNGKTDSDTKGQHYASALQIVPGLPKIKQLSAGTMHYAALDENGNYWGWGYNYDYQVGQWYLGGDKHPAFPITFDRAKYGMPKLVKVAAGAEISGALDEAGNVWMWGENNDGELGRGVKNAKSYAKNYPQKAIFPAGVFIVNMEINHENTFAIDSEGRVWAWGDNTYGECGQGTKIKNVMVPTLINFPGNAKIKQLSMEKHWGVALDTAGNVWQWGLVHGQTSVTSLTTITTPVKVEFDETAQIVAPTTGSGKVKIEKTSTYKMPAGGIVSVQSGWHACFAVDANGKAWAWGCNCCKAYGIVTDFSNSSCYTNIYSKKAIRALTITGNGNQDCKGKQLGWKSPQVAGSALDPKVHDLYPKASRNFPDGFWYTTGLGIRPEYAKVEMPFIAKISSFHDTFSILDMDGNIWTWSDEGEGCASWGPESMKVPLPTAANKKDSGLYGIRMYEPTLMRGMPGLPQEKTKTPQVTDVVITNNGRYLSGVGIPGATVYLSSNRIPSGDPEVTEGTIETIVDADGNFLFTVYSYDFIVGDIASLTQFADGYDLPSEPLFYEFA